MPPSTIARPRPDTTVVALYREPSLRDHEATRSWGAADWQALAERLGGAQRVYRRPRPETTRSVAVDRDRGGRPLLGWASTKACASPFVRLGAAIELHKRTGAASGR